MDFEWRLLIKNLNYGIIDPPAPSSAKTSLYRYKAEASAKERDPPELLLLSSIIAGKKRIFSRQIFTVISRFYVTADRAERNWAGGFCLLSSHCIRKDIAFQCLLVLGEINSRFRFQTQWSFFSLVYGRRLCAHSDGHHHGFFIHRSLNLSK